MEEKGFFLERVTKSSSRLAEKKTCFIQVSSEDKVCYGFLELVLEFCLLMPLYLISC